MSVVWRGYDEVLGRPVAVKLLAPKLATDPDLRGRVHREARAAARLSHPHITNVYDYGEAADGTPYVVMELVQGQSLAQRIAAGPLPWRSAVRVAAQVASALAAAHAQGLVHRDVTPANVMLSRTGVKVVDFGIAAAVGERDRAVLGTPSYLAPEQRAGGPAQAATDVYALGLLLHHAATGRRGRAAAGRGGGAGAPPEAGPGRDRHAGADPAAGTRSAGLDPATVAALALGDVRVGRAGADVPRGGGVRRWTAAGRAGAHRPGRGRHTGPAGPDHAGRLLRDQLQGDGFGVHGVQRGPEHPQQRRARHHRLDARLRPARRADVAVRLGGHVGPEGPYGHRARPDLQRRARRRQDGDDRLRRHPRREGAAQRVPPQRGRVPGELTLRSADAPRRPGR